MGKRRRPDRQIHDTVKKWHLHFHTETSVESAASIGALPSVLSVKNAAWVKPKSNLQSKMRPGTRWQKKADKRPRNPPPNTIYMARRLPVRILSKRLIFNGCPVPSHGNELPLCAFPYIPSARPFIVATKNPGRASLSRGLITVLSELYVRFSRIEPSPV